MTPSKLKQLHATHVPEGLFFERKTMAFFGDTMRNYGVRAQTETVTDILGESFECWVLYRRHPVNGGHCDDSYFCIDTVKRIIKHESSDYKESALAWLKLNRPAIFNGPLSDTDKIAAAESAGWKSEVAL